MKRISDALFVSMKPNADNVIALRIKEGEFYFLAWMEDAPNYRIQAAKSPEICQIERDSIMCGDLMEAVQNSDWYHRMYNLYLLDDDGHVIDEEEKKFQNEYDMFLSLVKNYERNGLSDPDDHDIFLITKEELSSVCDALRDGEYILIFE